MTDSQVLQQRFLAILEHHRGLENAISVADMSKAMPVVYAVAGLMVFLGVLALFRDIVQPISIGG